MKTVMSVVIDNKACNGLKGEWGLSIVVDYKGKKILVDAGASDLFIDNMAKLNIDIRDIDYAMLSHAHFDHANGIPAFFKKNDKAKFYIRETTKDNCYAKRLFFYKYIGIPKRMMDEYADRIEVVSGDYELMDGVYLLPHKTANLENIGKKEKMYLKTDNGYIFDNFAHEQSLVVDTDKGLVIINSCSHGGAVNIINEVKNTFKDKHIYGIIGGFHLYNKKDAEVLEVAECIKDTGIEFVCTGHCTEERAYNILKGVLKDKLIQLHSGLIMEF
ncbi:MAG: MBL fold metallo-hydrolase [Erysipelotrichaceae bacterium]|nr:MBL fold metallo-hydrolase [Erysipelotrichaceae bacterium]